MAGERILVVDDSATVQDYCRAVLEAEGYKVAVASNGVAALTYPDVPDIDLLIVDTHLREMSGLDTAKAVKSDQELYRKPVLLLVSEEEGTDRQSQTLMGANAYLKKPFEPESLLQKVRLLFEEREVMEKGRQYLEEAAGTMMKRLAETTIQQAIEQKTQIIVERSLQSIVTQVDQKARKEVDARVTQLTAEKEQELVKMTVHEVARSMIEKLAERKVSEAMDVVLREETEKGVRRVADGVLPGIIRERVRESIDQVLPKEVQRRVQKEAEDLVPEASQKVVTVIESAAQKLIPKMAREVTSEVVERQLMEAIDTQLPKHVQQMVAQELEAQVRLKIAPLVREAAESIKRKTRFLQFMTIGALLVGISFVAADRMLGDEAPWAPKREKTQQIEPNDLVKMVRKLLNPPSKSPTTP